MQFYVVYIQKAHPSDGWHMAVNERESVVYQQPTTMAERVHIADACALALELRVPTLIDEMSNDVDEAYAALPDRLYLVDAEGCVVYRSDRGPRGFRPDEFEQAISDHLGR